MSQTPKDTRSAAQKARDTASIIGSLIHEGFMFRPRGQAIHQRAEAGRITTEEAIRNISRTRPLKREEGADAQASTNPARGV